MIRMFLAVMAILAVTSSLVTAQDTTNEQKGSAIGREADRRDRGYGDSKAVLIMILKDRAGRTRERRLRMQILEAPNEQEGAKSLVVFDEPRDIRGTALLSHSHILEPDDQWLYLPALKRVKRISSINKSGSFVGSEFAYEDLTGQEFGKYSYAWLRDEPCGDQQCFVVERRPRYENSGYSRLVTWYDTAEYRVLRVDYYDLKGEFLKSVTLSDYRQYLDKFWRANRFLMENAQTGKSTELIYENYEFQTGLTDNDFTQASLTRVR